LLFAAAVLQAAGRVEVALRRVEGGDSPHSVAELTQGCRPWSVTLAEKALLKETVVFCSS